MFVTDDSLKSWIKPITEEILGTFIIKKDHPKFIDFKGIYTRETFRNYRITRRCVPFANRNKTLVLQYEVKFPVSYECGGGYLKVLEGNYDPYSFNDESPFAIRFGADVCEFERKIVLELKVNGTMYKYKKKHSFGESKHRQLFTFVLFPNDTYTIMVNLSHISSGNLEDDFEGIPEEFIHDNSVLKTSEWDDREFFIDESQTMPEYWNDEMIPDPTFSPLNSYWHTTETWNIPKIRNRRIDEEWKPRKIKKPRYDGQWRGKKLQKPNFTRKLHDLGNLSAVAIDIWQPYAGVFFDNILLTDSVEYAYSFAKATWQEFLRLLQDKEYDVELRRLSIAIGSAELAKTWINNMHKLSDDEFAKLTSKREKPHLLRSLKKHYRRFYPDHSAEKMEWIKKYSDARKKYRKISRKEAEYRYLTKDYFCQLDKDMPNACLSNRK